MIIAVSLVTLATFFHCRRPDAKQGALPRTSRRRGIIQFFALPMALAPSPQGGGVCRFLPFHVQRTIYLHSALSDLIPQSVENVMYQSDIHRL
jgi:hypothetical protein